eukprot:5490598-Pleurochrysis_carterae.AAC.2
MIRGSGVGAASRVKMQAPEQSRLSSAEQLVSCLATSCALSPQPLPLPQDSAQERPAHAVCRAASH